MVVLDFMVRLCLGILCYFLLFRIKSLVNGLPTKVQLWLDVEKILQKRVFKNSGEVNQEIEAYLSGVDGKLVILTVEFVLLMVVLSLIVWLGKHDQFSGLVIRQNGKLIAGLMLIPTVFITCLVLITYRNIKKVRREQFHNDLS